MITVGMNVTLGEALALIRNRQGLSMMEVAERANTSLAIVGKIERDDLDTVRLSETIAVAEVYGLSLHVGLIPQHPKLLGMKTIDTDKEMDNE